MALSVEERIEQDGRAKKKKPLAVAYGHLTGLEGIGGGGVCVVEK